MNNPSASVHSLLEQDMTVEAADLFVRLVVRYFASTGRGDGPVSTSLTPEHLARRFDEPLPRDARPLPDVVARLERDVMADSNQLCHPRSLGHQVSAPLPAAVWSEALIGALNQSGAVWEMSPAGTAIEGRVIRWMCDLAGLGPRSGGTFTSGGTEATFAALLAARAAAMPDAWSRGVSGRAVVVCGEHAHYGVARAVGELGIGTDNISVVPSHLWHLDPVALERTLQQLTSDSRTVIAVVATAGTTATGSFDDLDAIGAICGRHGVWLHVDAAHGGSALLSARHARRLKGIERAQSIAWDPHKTMLLPLTASMLLVADEDALQAAYNQSAPYLFHRNGGGRAWDQGLRTFQCSRRLDAIKVWVALQRYGADHLAVLYDRLCMTAARLYEMVRGRTDFVALNEPESNIVCFRYVGDTRAAGRSSDTAPVGQGFSFAEQQRIAPVGQGFSLAEDQRLDHLNQDLRERFNRSGEGWITTTALGGRRVLRVTVMNPRTTDEDLTRVLDGLSAMGRELQESQD